MGEELALVVDTEPGGQEVQAGAMPSMPTKKPEGHARQMELPGDDTVPNGQERHDASDNALGKALYVPDGQAAHEDAP